jgi:pyruvate dehydrogenase E2 component (dihydrolipoamide acetyltransferase)
MATKVHMEALSPTMEEGQLVKWLKQEGDEISEGDVLAEIETDKATMELVARGSGVLQGIKLKEGQTAPVGEVIAMIGEAGAEAPGAEAEAEAGGDAGGEPKAEAEAEAAAGGDAEGEHRAEAEAEEEPGAGDHEADDGAEPESGKAGRKVEAGKPPKGEARDSDDAGSDKAAASRTAAPKPETGAREQATAAKTGGDARVKASPLARRLAEEAGLDLSAVEGSGPGGRITKRDIEAAVEDGGGRREDAEAAAPKDTAGEATSPAAAAAPQAEAGADSEEVPVSQMRKAIARRLAQSIGPIPTFYLTVETDMTRLNELRQRANERLEKDGVKASINDFIIKAVAVALARHPEVNASWGDSVIVRHNRVHMGVAVAIDDGLITPIIRDADRKRVRDIAIEVKELAARAREKKLKPEEYTGATFSISNLGMFGIVEFTAIINPPEAGILAVGAVEEKPVVADGEVVVRPRMRLTMSCDHRVIDGAMGAKFLQTVQELIEDPMMMIA